MSNEERLDDVWASRDFPVLVEVARRIDAGATTVSLSEVVKTLELSTKDVQRAAKALERRGLLETMSVLDGHVLRVRNLSGAAYLMTGLHPDGDDAISRLISALEQAVEQTTDEDKRGRLRRLADSLKDSPREIVGAVISTAIATGLGLS
jgi:DNA-binding MarR family transcriptional regulator